MNIKKMLTSNVIQDFHSCYL